MVLSCWLLQINTFTQKSVYTVQSTPYGEWGLKFLNVRMSLFSFQDVMFFTEICLFFINNCKSIFYDSFSSNFTLDKSSSPIKNKKPSIKTLYRMPTSWSISPKAKVPMTTAILSVKS